jgi:hypothetical protein
MAPHCAFPVESVRQPAPSGQHIRLSTPHKFEHSPLSMTVVLSIEGESCTKS